jgi:macrolide-specific efflux system membrane fusion protein
MPYSKINSMVCAAALAAGQSITGVLWAADHIRVENVLVALSEHVELPAKVAGPLSDLSIREGDIVEPGQQLAALEDQEARIAASKAQRELAIAQKKAENDVSIRFARKAHEVAAAEYRRAQESVEKFRKSVSETELDQLRLAAEKALLAIEQAQDEQTIARLTLHQKETELEAARLKLDQHRVNAPFAGMVVQVKKQRGEWLSPGETVLRLVRLDRLRVEAFVPARDFSANLHGERVKFVVDASSKGSSSFDGVVAFVSPEVNPVNGQVRLWAEIENKSLLLRPGQAGTLVVPSAAPLRGAQRSNAAR